MPKKDADAPEGVLPPRGTVTTFPAPTAPGTALAAPVQSQDAILDLIAKATDRGISAEVLEKFQAMYERSRDDARRAALVSALVAFQSEVNVIPRTKPGKRLKNGTIVSWYAPLDAIERIVRPLLRDHMLAVRWDTKPDESGASVTVTCYLMHADGAELTASTRFPVGRGTDLQTAQEALVGVVTFGRRHTLIEVLGLTTCDADQAPPEDAETISDSQAADIRALASEVGVTEERICEKAGVKSLEELPASKAATLVAALTAKRRGV